MPLGPKRGFWTRMVYLNYITCLRYTILARKPQTHMYIHLGLKNCVQFYRCINSRQTAWHIRTNQTLRTWTGSWNVVAAAIALKITRENCSSDFIWVYSHNLNWNLKNKLQSKTPTAMIMHLGILRTACKKQQLDKNTELWKLTLGGELWPHTFCQQVGPETE